MVQNEKTGKAAFFTHFHRSLRKKAALCMSVVPEQPQTCEAVNPVSAGKSGFLDDGQFVVKSNFLTGSLSFNWS